ncbi:MAG TPA: DUF481 domain-containing protein [bacterium]
MRHSPISVIAGFLAVLGWVATVRADEVTLKNGDRVSGAIIEETESEVRLEHEALGVLSIPMVTIARVERDEARPDAAAQGASGADTAAALPSADWSGEVALGADVSRGNTDERDVSGLASTDRKTDHDEFSLKGEAAYGASSRKMNTQRYYGMSRYAYSFGPRLAWYNFYKLEADHDRFANVDWRVIPSTGAGYWFADEEAWKAMAELGIGWEVTEFRGGAKRRSDPVLIPRALAEARLWGKATVSQDVTLWPNLDETGEFRLRAETTLTSPLTDALAIRLRFLDEYQSDPPPGTRENDARLTSSLVYSF